MAILQLSVFLENSLGRLKEVLSILESSKINIRALSLADKSNYGILRLIVDNPQVAVERLKRDNISVNAAPVMAAEVEDRPGGLLRIVEIMVKEGLNIEYMYAFVEKCGDKAVVVFRVEENEKAEDILRKNDIKLFGE